MNVLIVEDNPLMRAMIRETVSEFASVVAECCDGNRALSFFRKYRPDWVLMDQNMPKMNGAAATREIIAEFPQARICMVTAYGDESVRREALLSGASEFVLKDNLSDLETVLVKDRHSTTEEKTT